MPEETNQPPWRGTVNGVLYAIQFTRDPDRAEADRVARMIRDGRSLTGGVQRYRDAVRAALAQTGPVGDLPTGHPEPVLRAFLQELDRALN
jgi:hypothetical protein